MAHALGVGGAAAELVHATGHGPVLRPSDRVYLGTDLDQTTDGERQHLAALAVTVAPQVDLTENPRGAASTALQALSDGPFFVHLDVDVLDFLDLPVAENVNGRNSGPSLAQLEPALAELWSRPDCLGLSIGQVDPGHAASDPTALDRSSRRWRCSPGRRNGPDDVRVGRLCHHVPCGAAEVHSRATASTARSISSSVVK